MIKKKVLVHGSLKSLNDFFKSRFGFEFEPLAVLTDEPEKVAILSREGDPLEIFATENLPRFALRFIDGILLTDASNVYYDIKRFTKMGIEPRKIILWNSQCFVESFDDTEYGVPVTFMNGLQFHIRNDDDKEFLNNIRVKLMTQRQFYAIKPEEYFGLVAFNYLRNMGKPLDWDNLQTYTEKMQWLKLCDSTPIKTRLADKFLVRQWIAEKIGADYLIPLYGVWDKFEDIDFDALPNQFVLKCNHGSGMNIICRDKNSFDFENAREKLTAWLSWDFGTWHFEPHYLNIKRKIIAEKFMTDGKNFDLTDYKFWCFNGKPCYCLFYSDRSTDCRLDYFNMNWKLMNFESSDHPNSDHPEKIRKPKTFDKMKKLAAELCRDFAHVRVDFYEIGGRIFFGEMTFTPAATYLIFKPESTDAHLGSLLTLPAPSKFPREARDFKLNYSVRQKILPAEDILPKKVQPVTNRVIATLTSWTKRIATVHLAIQTILEQTRQPDLTVLYLADSEFPNREKDLPRELTALLSDRFEIRWTKDIKSYKKLIPALKDFPDDVIITFDDDLFYDKRIIEISMEEYAKNPQYIHCHRVTNISFDKNGKVKISAIPYEYPTYLNKLSGGLACLYPPHSLPEEVMCEEKFMKLAPSSDDIWFWLMGAMNGFKVNVVKNNIDILNYIPDTQEVGLTQINDKGEKLFFVHLQNILNAYPQLKEILKKEWSRVVAESKIIPAPPPVPVASYEIHVKKIRLAIYGYGKIEKDFVKLFRARINDAEIRFFISNVHLSVKDIEGNVVIPMEELKRLIDDKQIDKVIMLADSFDTNPAGELRNFMKKCFKCQINFRDILFYSETAWFLKLFNTKGVTSFKECMKEAERKVPVIAGLEYEMVEFCNLNCKRCNHYSNIFTDGKLIDFDTFKADMKLLSELTCNIKRFKLLGGEPLLHPELDRFVECSRKFFPHASLAIVTNGFLIPKMTDAAIKAIKDTDTVIEISIYPPMKNIFGKIEKFLTLHGIKYKIFRQGDTFGAYINPKGDSDKMEAMMQCYAQVCPAVKNGILYRCTSSMNISLLNKKFGTNFPEEFKKMSDIPKENAGKVITEYLLDTIDMCRFCTSLKFHDWQATKNDASINDWIAY